MKAYEPNRIAAQNDDGFLAFSPRYLLPETTIEFPVFLKRDEEYVLYARKGDDISEVNRTQLESIGQRFVYLPDKDMAEYEAYVRSNIAAILDDDLSPPEERARTWCDTACALARDFFEQRLPEEMIKQHFSLLETMLRNTTRFMTEPGALKRLARFISKNEEGYHHGIGTMIYSCCLLQTYDADDLLHTAAGLGALLHDIGYSRLPAALVSKDPATMTESERVIFESHPAISLELCRSFPLLPESIDCVMLHHERLDGTGFPSGAMADDIPLHARAVALANAYDSLTRQQPWQPPLSPFEALKIIRDNVGAFDGELFRRLVVMLSEADIIDTI